MLHFSTETHVLLDDFSVGKPLTYSISDIQIKNK